METNSRQVVPQGVRAVEIVESFKNKDAVELMSGNDKNDDSTSKENRPICRVTKERRFH